MSCRPTLKGFSLEEQLLFSLLAQLEFGLYFPLEKVDRVLWIGNDVTLLSAKDLDRQTHRAESGNQQEVPTSGLPRAKKSFLMERIVNRLGAKFVVQGQDNLPLEKSFDDVSNYIYNDIYQRLSWSKSWVLT